MFFSNTILRGCWVEIHMSNFNCHKYFTTKQIGDDSSLCRYWHIVLLRAWNCPSYSNFVRFANSRLINAPGVLMYVFVAFIGCSFILTGILFLYLLFLFVSYLGGMVSPCRYSVINKRNQYMLKVVRYP